MSDAWPLTTIWEGLYEENMARKIATLNVFGGGLSVPHLVDGREVNHSRSTNIVSAY